MYSSYSCIVPILSFYSSYSCICTYPILVLLLSLYYYYRCICTYPILVFVPILSLYYYSILVFAPILSLYPSDPSIQLILYPSCPSIHHVLNFVSYPCNQPQIVSMFYPCFISCIQVPCIYPKLDQISIFCYCLSNRLRGSTPPPLVIVPYLSCSPFTLFYLLDINLTILSEN